MRENTMAIGQLNAKHCIGQQLDDRAFYFNCVFARHVRISGSPFVTRTVCSKWADGIPSAVRTVHPSSSNLTSATPILIIGSIARVIPALDFGPLAADAVHHFIVKRDTNVAGKNTVPEPITEKRAFDVRFAHEVRSRFIDFLGRNSGANQLPDPVENIAGGPA